MIKLNRRLKEILLGVSGVISGFLSGLFGAGGGMVTLFSLSLLRPEDDSRDRFAATICSILPMTAVSAVFYFIRGDMAPADASPYLIPGAIGGLIGAFALGKLPLIWIRRFLAVILLFSGGAMVFGL